MSEMIKRNLVVIGLVLVSALIIFNSIQIFSLSESLGEKSPINSLSFGTGTGSKSTAFKVKSGGDTVQNVMEAIMPKGVPEYGEVLGVSYDTPETSINVLAKLDRALPTNQLTEAEKQRYINVTTRISCEFCCGAPYITDPNGRDACGCAHSASFRGLTKYLIKNEPDKWTDEQILAELTRWKALYYPRNMVEKGVAAVENGLELTPAVLNDRELLKKLKTGDKGNIGNLPDMVGGC